MTVAKLAKKLRITRAEVRIMLEKQKEREEIGEHRFTIFSCGEPGEDKDGILYDEGEVL